jgi:hypothetical protein
MKIHTFKAKLEAKRPFVYAVKITFQSKRRSQAFGEEKNY